MTETQSQSFDQWCIVELFGHNKIAGRVSEQAIGGCSFIRVDVPEVNGRPAFTKLYGNGAIYGITPVTEEIALQAVKVMGVRPVDVYYLPQPATVQSAPPEGSDDHIDDDLDDEDDDLDDLDLSSDDSTW